MIDPTTERIAAAKLWLISRPPRVPAPEAPADLAYLSVAVYALVTVPSVDVDMARADDHWRLYVNPVWIAEASVPMIGRELAHIVWHLLMDHADRARATRVDASTAAAWHLACDLAIADTLADTSACPDRIQQGAAEVRAANPRLGTGRSAEDYFALLTNLPAAPASSTVEGVGEDRRSCGSAVDGIRRASDLPPDTDIGQQDRFDADVIREQVAIEYLEARKSRGQEPGYAGRWAKQITNPTIPWEPLLARAVRRGIGWTSGRHEPTWTRPSRRQSVQPDVLRPGWRRPVPSVAVVVDTSASIDDKLLGRAMGEVEGVLAGLGIPNASITVLACDAAVGAVRRVRKATDAALVGGGGTDMRVGLAAAAELRPRPDLIVVFTDGYTPWPASAPAGSAVIAAMLQRPGEPLPGTPVWATRIDCVLT